MGIRKTTHRGIALLIVLSAIVVMTTLVVDFTYTTNVSYHQAVNERERIQAYYLAKSALSFMFLELKFDKVFRQIVQSQNLGQFLGENANLPLCQQFPLSTALIRAVFLLGQMPGEASAESGEAGEAAEPKSEADEVIEEQHKDVSISQEKSAEEFLQFEGDFDASCVDEGTKINLNGFFDLRTTSAVEGQASPFDQYKLFLLKFLTRPQYELLFEKAGVKASDAVDNIGDWVDQNADAGKLAGRSSGSERAVYDKQELPYTVRNGKLLTLMEAYLIDGVTDDWFGPLMEEFTVYGDGRINVCSANETVVEALIQRYVDSTPGLPPLRLEDKEEMGRLTGAIADACASGASGEQMKQQVVAALTSAIGAVSSGAPATPVPPPPATPAQQGAQGAQTQSQESGFGSYINMQPRFYSLKLTGQIKDTVVRIKAVVDVKEQDPKKWKLMYWRVY